MRTTINLDDDAYLTVQAISKTSGKPLGEVVSEAIRQHFAPDDLADFAPPDGRFPFYSFPGSGHVADPEAIRREIEEEGTEAHLELTKRIEALRR